MTSEYALVGLPTRYSSWTARVETLLKYYDIPYTPRVYNSFNPTAPQPPAPFKGGLVPVLQPFSQSDPDFLIRDSLAISEYLAENHAELPFWPEDSKLRALARSIVAQMHSGFPVLRNAYAVNFVVRYSGEIPVSAEGKAECLKMVGFWSTARKETKERLQKLGQADDGFLFGKFGIADCFFWPVLWRFRTYNLPLEGISEDGLKWMETIWNDEKLQQIQSTYYRQAEDPTTTIEKFDNNFSEVDGVKMESVPEGWRFKA